jgi:hypothetical protein
MSRESWVVYVACLDGGTDTGGPVVMSDTHPGDFGDRKNIFANLALDTHKGCQNHLYLFGQSYRRNETGPGQ